MSERFLLMAQRCRMFRIFVFVLFVSSVNFLNAQEIEEDKRPTFVKQQSAALKGELKRLQDEVGLDENTASQIEKELEEAVMKAADAMKIGFDQSDTRDMGREPELYKGRIHRELARKIHEAAAPHLNGEEWEAYRQDFESFVAWQDNVARKCVVVFLDTYLELAPEQVAEIEKRLERNWDYIWDYRCFQVGFEGYRSVEPVLVDLETDPEKPNQITELLTDVQKETFASLDHLGRNYSALVGVNEDEEAKLMTADLQRFLKRVTERYSTEGELTARQASRLKVGFRGALKNVLKRRRANLKLYLSNGNLWNMAAVMESSFQQMRSDPIWQKTLKGMLEGEARVERQQEAANRRQRSMELGAVFAISYLTRFYRLPYRETIDLYEKATADIKRIEELNIYRGTYVLFGYSDEELSEILSEETMKAIQPRLQSSKAWKRPPQEEEVEDEEKE